MTRRAGTADLPLHGGRIPRWLTERMERLGRVIAEAIVLEYGRDELLRRLAHPFWFQSFGAVMGMDWHSSGMTTAVVGAMKYGLAPAMNDLGFYVCGGRGRHALRTPDELRDIGERTGADAVALTRASRLVAKVDNAAVQDGFDLYLHAFFVAADGQWTVVQQGMAPAAHYARRYHWCSHGLSSFVDDPHAAIDGPPAAAPILNLVDRRAAASRDAQLALVRLGPERALAAVRAAQAAAPSPRATPETAPDASDPHTPLPHLHLPAHHDVRASDVVLRRLHATLAAAAERGPIDYAELLLTPNVGARTVEALALVAEVVHGAPSRFGDPARFSLAHGGKDGHPFPVPLDVYDRTVRVLREAVRRARLGQDDKLAALRRLDAQARALDDAPAGPTLEAHVARERERSHLYGGRSVAGFARPPAAAPAAAPDPDEPGP